MGTPSMIGASARGRGRFVSCQFDGYPTGVGNALRALVERDGAQQALATILDQGNTGGWRNIEPDHQPQTWRHSVSVPGYGVAYRDHPNTPDLTLRESLTDQDVAYVYTIHPDRTITIRQCARYVHNALLWRLPPGQNAHDDHPPRDAQPHTTD